jgi:hypothetical protein
MTPFSLVLEVLDKGVTVNPDLLQGEDTSHIEEAKKKGVAVNVSAEALQRAFKDAPDVVRRFVPAGDGSPTPTSTTSPTSRWAPSLCWRGCQKARRRFWLP